MANAKFYVALGSILLMSHSMASASDFVAYEGRDAVQIGNGGEKKTVDGVDFWSHGSPARKFRIVGYLTDSRPKNGLIGMIWISRVDSGIARQARKAGGDAVILANSEAVTKGYVADFRTNSTTANTSASVNATGNSTPASFGATTPKQGQSNSATPAVPPEQRHTTYVIRYLADASGNSRASAP